ncbi:MAG: T9SS type A sorting domain-containing protein [Candidatus Marinimicrobia bacterium]|nr:T9SS type A sorting domain-containing protein [Candidatus Neomarinimicrobiota bacterium]
MKKVIFSFLFFLISSFLVNAGTINVPADQATIQAALNVANSGDTILVQPGTYQENIYWPYKNGIKLISASDASNTIIDGGGKGSVIHINPSNANIDTTTLIKGFTLQNGGNVNSGGGLFIVNSSPKLMLLIVRNNKADDGGGGFYCGDGSSPTIKEVIITGNSAYEGGGILSVNNSSPKLTNVTISGNSADKGGGICCSQSPLKLTGVIISGNSADKGGGICCEFYSYTLLTLIGVTISDNSAHYGGGIYGGFCSQSQILTDITFINNSSTNGDGVYIHSGNPIIDYCNFVNQNHSIYNNNSANIEATNNWFGNSSGPYHPIQNISGKGDSVNVSVNIYPWLTSPSTSAPPIPIQNLQVVDKGNDFVKLSWNSSKMSDLNQYRIYYDTDTTDFYEYTDSINVDKSDTSVTITGLQLGKTYYFSGITIDNDGNKSWYSKEVSAMTRVIEIQNLDIGGNEDILHLVTHSPDITYNFYDSFGDSQTNYYIQVSSRSDFSDIDMWDSGEIASSDTSVIYDGQELQDGEIYYLRARVAGGDFWSDWSTRQFRMNSKPSIPVLISPINNKVSGVPIVLKILNSTDAENDNLTYSFNVYGNAVLTEKIDSVTAVTEATDTTSWQIITTLIDNGQYCWTALANDGYEESTVSDAASFLLNSANDAPNAFSLLSPADSADVITLTPLLDWEASIDPDPLDTVSYNLYFGSSIPDLQLISVDTLTSYRILSPLSDNTNYYWKVIAKDLNGATTENTGGYRLFRVNTENEFPNPFSLITPTEYSVEIDLTPIFVWENNGDPDGGELTFNLYYSMDSSFTETVTVMTDSNNFIPVDSLMDNSTYFWKVIAKDSGLLQTETDTWCFWTNTELEPPNPFDLLLPKDGENCLPIVPEFVWSKATDNDPNDYAVYNLLISKDETFSEVDVFVEGLIDTSFVLTEGLDDNNQYYWKIEAIDTDSLLTSSEVFSFVVGTLSIDDLQGIPTEYSLSQNYPNPFNPTTTISYQLPRSSFVKLTIYDISGRSIQTLIDEKKNAGYYTVEWNAKNVCSGVYFYRIEAGNFVAVKKGLLVK